jgi:hypothetical protein
MANYVRIFHGTDNKESAKNAVAIIHSAIKLLVSKAQISQEPAGTLVRVQFDLKDENLRKILEGLGFKDSYGSLPLKEPSELRKEDEKVLLYPSDQKQPEKPAEIPEKNKETGDYRVPPGRYRKDGTDVVYNAAGLTIRLGRQEFGPGIRFFREGDGTKWVTVLIGTTYQLTQVEE